MKALLPILKTKLFLLGFVSACTVILATTVPQIRNLITPEKAGQEKIKESKIDPEKKKISRKTSASKESSGSFEATVVSDRPDYAPLSTAVFTGDGFGANEEVVLKVKNLDQPCNTVAADSSYFPWTVITDVNGHFETTWTVCNCPGDSLRLKATGQQSGRIAYAYFTDALPVDPDLIITSLSTTGPFCRGSQFTVYFATGNNGDVYGAGNIFTVQLGNGGGNWPNNPDEIGSTPIMTGTNLSGSINVTIPLDYNGVGSTHNIRIAASNPLTGGADFNTEIVIENPPQDYNVTGGGAYCPDVTPNGLPVGLQDSEAPFVQNNTTYYFSYQLYLNGNPIGSPVLGTGSAITFGDQTQTGTYTVIATNGRTTCTALMKGNAIITSAITAPTLTPDPTSTAVCEGTSVKATVTAGSGGTGTIVDHVEYRLNNGSWVPGYISNTPISTTGLTSVDIRAYRTADGGTGCHTSPTTMVSWVIDGTPPVFTGDYSTVPLGCNPGASDITTALGSATATDGCGTPTVDNGVDGSISSTDCQRSQTRTFTATDAGGKTATISRTVTWTEDITPPDFTGNYADVNLGCNPANPTGSLGTATATDACGTITNISSSDGSVVSSGCNRSIKRTFTATDGCLNTSTVSRTVKWIEDVTPPGFTGSYTDVDLGCNPVNPAGSLGTATATDACGPITDISSSDGSVVSTGCNRSIKRTFTATDGCLNTSTISRTVKWSEDVTAPDFTGTYTDVNLGCNPAHPAGSLGTATATDACGTITNISSSDGNVVSTGCNRSQTRTFTATDGCLNTSTVSRTVRWTEDVTPPGFTGYYNDVNLGCNPVSPLGSLGTATATDACGAITNISSSDGSVVSTGCNRSIKRTFTATDGCLNTSTISRTVKWIEDVTPPGFTGSYTDVDLGCNPVNPGGSLGTATATDACGAITNISSSDGSVVTSGCNRSQKRTFTATDGCLNTSTTSRTVKWVEDITPAGFTGYYNDVNLGCNPANPAASLGTATATDACGTITNISSSDGSVVTSGCNRSIKRTFTATDGCLNTSTTSRTVRWVEDVTPPVFTGYYNDVNLGCNPVNPAGSLGTASATDACGTITNISSADGSVVSSGCNRSQTRTFTATDGCLNTSTISRTVRWKEDVTPPTLTAGGTTLSLGCNPSASDINDALGTATATDACGTPGVVPIDGPLQSSGCGRSQKRTFTATDGCNNTATACRLVTWTYDVTPPTASNVTSNYKCAGDVPAPDPAVITNEADNCGGTPTVTYISTATTTNGGAGCPGDPLIITRYYKIMDACSNSSTASHTITVVDDVAPTIVCKNISVTLSTAGTADITASDVTASASDNCGSSVGLSVDKTHFTDAEVGTASCSKAFSVKLTGTDACNNTSTCNATVTVNKRSTKLVYSGDASGQYSDPVNVKATLYDISDGEPGVVLAGKTIKFTIGSQSVTAITNASGVASANITLNQSPTPTYNVVSCFVTDGFYCGSTDTDSFDITPEDACGAYDGTLFVNSNSASGGTANVHLQVQVTEAADGNLGNLANATVTFSVTDGASTSTYLATRDVSTFSKDITITLSSSQLCKTLDVSWTINNYYTNATCPEQSTEVTVAAPADDFSAGGGYLILTSSAYGPNTGSGTAAGSKNNWGYNVKWNKSLTNLQGNFNTIIRKNGRTYQVKSNKPTFLKITIISAPNTLPVKRKAEITYTNATFKDVTDIVNGVCVAPSCWGDGNGSIYLTVEDNGEPGSSGSPLDRIGFGIKDKNNNLWFSTNTWTNSTSSAALQNLDGGNIQIRQGSTNVTTSNQTVRTDITTDKPAEVLPFNVKATPNPTEHQFTLYLEGASNEKVAIVVYDAIGRQVKKIERGDGSGAIRFGEDLKVGVYVVEVRQGANRKTMKLIKQ